jgi:hypothetical protein
MKYSLTDCHSRGKAVGVENNVRNHSRFREGQIFCRPLLTANSLLSRSASKLVSNSWVPLEFGYS